MPVEPCTERNFPGDFLGRLRGLHRQRFHFRSHHGKAAAGLAGARRLDRGVERQQIGLPGDVLNELDHVADLLRDVRERRDVVVGGGGVGGRAAHDFVGLRELAADLLDRSRQLLGGGGRGLDIGRSLVGAVHRAFGALQRMVGGRQQRSWPPPSSPRRSA